MDPETAENARLLEQTFFTAEFVPASEANRQSYRELADFYEECGDDDAARYYRRCSETESDFLSRPYPRDSFRWLDATDYATMEDSFVASPVFAALEGEREGSFQRCYPTYADAVRDLGRALKTVMGEHK